MIFRDRQTDRHFIIIYISSSPSSDTSLSNSIWILTVKLSSGKLSRSWPPPWRSSNRREAIGNRREGTSNRREGKRRTWQGKDIFVYLQNEAPKETLPISEYNRSLFLSNANVFINTKGQDRRSKVKTGGFKGSSSAPKGKACSDARKVRMNF